MGLFDRVFGRRRREARRALEANVRATLEQEGPEAAWGLLLPAIARERDPVGLFHLAAHVLRLRGEGALAELFDRAADAPHDPQRLFELGSELSSADEPEAAAAMLERALAFSPFDAVVRSELALAYSQSGRPDRVVEALALHPCLADDPGALFQFGWASLLSGDLDAAEGALRQLRAAPPLRKKLRDALERARLGMAVDPPDARDWLFVEHGAVLVDSGGELGGRYDAFRLERRLVGQVAGLVKTLLAPPRRVVAIDEEHRPLADALACACEGTLVARGPGRIPAAVVPLLSGRHVAELSREDLDAEGVLLVSLTVDFTRALPRVPDVVGAFAREVTLAGDAFEEVEPAVDEGLRAFLEERRAYLRATVGGPRTAYVPDEPLPR